MSQIQTFAGAVSADLPGNVATSYQTDSGTAVASAHVLKVKANPPNSGSSVGFSASGNEIDLNLVDGSQNLILGYLAGNNTFTGLLNTAIGETCLDSFVSGNENTVLGANSLTELTNAGSNTAIGFNSLPNLLTGTTNIALGANSGIGYTSSESNNILIGNQGTVADANTMRLGTTGSSDGQVNKTFVAAVSGTSVTGDPVYVSSSGQLGVSAAVSGIFGDGSDGAQTFDGSATVLGLVPSGGVYSLTRDIFLGSSSISNTAQIASSGFRIYCNGTLTNNGTIQSNGGSGTTGGTANIPGMSAQTIGGSGLGGGGKTGAGTSGGSSAVSGGGSGGAGGTGGSAGGSFGVATVPAAIQGTFRSFPMATTGAQIGNSADLRFNGGGGGGGGGGDGTNAGGSGGAGGGVVLINAYKIAGTGNIQAKGGNGGNGAVGATNAGGGGSGGGGLILITSTSVSSGAIAGQTISVAAGTPGNGVGTGTNGSAGSAGTVVLLNP